MYSDPPPTIEALHEALFKGAIIRFGGLPEMQALAQFAQGFLTDMLAPHDPVTIHRHFGRDALAIRLDAVQRAFSNAPEAKALWRALFEAIGFANSLLA